MKRLIGWVGMLCFFASVTMTQHSDSRAGLVSRLGIEKLEDEKADYIEIAGLEKKIMSALRGHYHMAKGKNLPKDFKLDFRNAQKVYIDSEIFALEKSDAVSIRQALRDSNYMWLLTVKIGDDTFQIHIARGLPLDGSVEELLSEEEIQGIKAEEGKWSLSGIEKLEGEGFDYEEKISDVLDNISYDKEDADVVICGGLAHIGQPAALVLDDERENLLIPLHELQMEGSEKQIQGLKPESAHKEDEVYLYEEIKKASNRMSDTGEVMVGGGGYIVLSAETDGTNITEKADGANITEETNGFGGYFAFIIVGLGIVLAAWVARWKYKGRE